MSRTASTSRAGAYRLLWRWHFYAGLFCLPFVLWLACTGLIYLFKPQIEPLLEQRYAHVTDAPPRPASAQVAAAPAAVPGTMLNAYQLPASPHAATRVLLGRDGELVRVYVDPASLRVLHVVRENDRFMRVVFYLHGELMLGTAGSMLVELAASWTILLLRRPPAAPRAHRSPCDTAPADWQGQSRADSYTIVARRVRGHRHP